MSMTWSVNSPIVFGAAARTARMGMGLSQQEMSARTGISQRWISELENGKPKEMNEDFFARLDMLGVQMKLVVNE